MSVQDDLRRILRRGRYERVLAEDECRALESAIARIDELEREVTAPNLDGLFCGDGASAESIAKRREELEQIVNGPLKVEMLVIAWEAGHDAGMLIERKRQRQQAAEPRE